MEEGFKSVIQTSAVYGVWIGSILLIPSLLRGLKNHLVKNPNCTPVDKIISRNLDLVDSKLPLRKQMSEYLKLGGIKEVKYWFHEIDLVEIKKK